MFKSFLFLVLLQIPTLTYAQRTGSIPPGPNGDLSGREHFEDLESKLHDDLQNAAAACAPTVKDYFNSKNLQELHQQIRALKVVTYLGQENQNTQCIAGKKDNYDLCLESKVTQSILSAFISSKDSSRYYVKVFSETQSYRYFKSLMNTVKHGK